MEHAWAIPHQQKDTHSKGDHIAYTLRADATGPCVTSPGRATGTTWDVEHCWCASVFYQTRAAALASCLQVSGQPIHLIWLATASAACGLVRPFGVVSGEKQVGQEGG